MTDVFISYSRKDIAFARLLHKALVENGLETWIDWQDIPPSADWLAEVYEAIEGADAFVFIISETSLASEICGLEIAHAAKHNKRLIPIVIKDIEAEKVPKELSVLNWIFFDDAGEKFAEAMQDLVTAITVDQAWVKGHTRFQNRALDWERKERDHGALLRGADLSEAEAWLGGSAGKDPGPTALQTEYILKSREDATKRQRRTLMGVGAALVVAVGLGVLAWTQRNVAVSEGYARATAQAQAEEQRDIADEQRIAAEARQLAALSQAYVETDLDLAILLGIEGHKRDPNYLTQGSLLAVLQQNPYTLRQYHLPLRVADLEFHPDGGFFATASGANIQFWDPVKSVQVFEPIIGHTRLVHDLAINNQGSLLASTSEDGTVKLWDLNNNRELVGTLLENDSLSSALYLAFSPDDSILAAVTENEQVWVWDTQTLEVVSLQAAPLEFEGTINGIVINNTNQIILHLAETVEVWDYQSGQRIAQLAGESIDEIAFNASTKLLAGFDEDEPRFYIWNSDTGEQIKKIRLTSPVYDYSTLNMQIHPDGKWLFLITDDVIQYIDWQDPDKVHTLQTLPKSTYANSQNILAFNPNGRSIIYGGSDGIVYLRSVYGTDQENDPFYGYQGAGYGLSLSPDEEVLAATGLNEDDQPIINLWDFPGLNFIGSINLGQDDTQFRSFLDYRTLFLPDGTLVFSGIDEQISFFDPGNLTESSTQFWNKEDIDSIAVSPNGRYLAALNIHVGELQIWDIESEELLGELALTEENKLDMWAFKCVAFSPDNKTLAAGVGIGLITFWDLETLEIIGDPIIAHDGGMVSLEYSHDGKILASSDSQGEVLLWDTETRFSIGVPMIKGSAMVNKILFNQDDSMIFTGDNSGEITLWDVRTQQPIGLPITDLSGRQLAADLPDFDAFYGRSGHQDPITNMVLSSDDRYLISMDNGGTIRIWDFDIDSWYERACYKAGRNLSQNEWGLYFPNESFQATCPQFAETSDQVELDNTGFTTRTREIDNMVQVFVPAGEFEFGSRTWTNDGAPYRILDLDPFWIDQTEVTNAQYQLCVASGSCKPPASNSSSTRISSYYGYDIYADYPVIFVSFRQAEEYCRWVGGRVPIETEWEKAARGTSGYDYPWGNAAPTSSLVNFHFMELDTTAAGSYPAGSSPYGALDMVGNVREWTYDYNEEGDSELPIRIRGGAYNTTYAYTWMVESLFDGYYWNDLGFRCVNDD